MKKYTWIIMALLCGLSIGSCDDDEITQEGGGHPDSSKPIPIIFDTDLGNCTDDALAMQALFKLRQQGLCEVIGLMSNFQLEKGRELADRFLHYYKADDVPLGILPGEVTCFDMIPYYQLVDSLRADGTPLFPPTGIPLNQRLPAWKLYRKLLSEAEEQSVVIVCIGMYTNLGQLLDSSPDEYSPLSGRELVSRKVKRLEATGGCFAPVPLRYPSEEGKTEFLTVEYNVAGDIPMAKKVLENWPTMLCLLPMEEGMKYPSNHDEVLADYAWQPDCPMYQIYSHYDEWAIGDVGQYWWDALVMLHAGLGEESFNCTRQGILSISDSGQTSFTLSEGGKAHIISTNAEHTQSVYDWLRSLSQFKP